MKKVKIEIPDDCELIQTGEGKWEQRKIEKKLPKTWAEFCETHPIKEDECFLNPGMGIAALGELPDDLRKRNTLNGDIIPNKETAEAVLALIQLLQLRNCYNDGWEPDWSSSIKEKYVIISDYSNNRGDLVVIDDVTEPPHSVARILTFKSKELRDQFLENFRDLIEIAKPLI